MNCSLLAINVKFKKKNLLTYSFEKQSNGDRGKQAGRHTHTHTLTNFHPLIQSPNNHNSLVEVAKIRTQKLHSGLLHGCGAKDSGLWAILSCTVARSWVIV